jgi:hypothetical protein
MTGNIPMNYSNRMKARIKNKRVEKQRVLLELIIEAASWGCNIGEIAAHAKISRNKLDSLRKKHKILDNIITGKQSITKILAKKALHEAIQIDIEGKLSLQYLSKVDDSFSEKSNITQTMTIMDKIKVDDNDKEGLYLKVGTKID